MIAQFTVEFGINSTCNALNSIRLCLMLFRELLVLLIPNTTVNCAITYTNCLQFGGGGCIQNTYYCFFLVSQIFFFFVFPWESTYYRPSPLGATLSLRDKIITIQLPRAENVAAKAATAGTAPTLTTLTTKFLPLDWIYCSISIKIVLCSLKSIGDTFIALMSNIGMQSLR